jgi:hypothetical protein
LSTTSISAGYSYDINEGTSSWNAGISYQGTVPYFGSYCKYSVTEKMRSNMAVMI